MEVSSSSCASLGKVIDGNSLKEWIEWKWVVVKLDSSDITDDFKSQTTDHSYEVSPSTVIDPKSQIGHQHRTEKRQVEKVTRQIRNIVEVGETQWTSIQCTVVRGVCTVAHHDENFSEYALSEIVRKIEGRCVSRDQ
jgi:hypothetical protein